MIQPGGQSDISKTYSLIALNVVLLLTAGYSHAQDDEFNKALKARVAARWDYEAERQKTLLDKDKFTVFLAGTGSPTNRNRLMSGTAVFANGKFFLFDAGDGTVEKLEQMGLPLPEIDAVFVTHFHSDHMDDLGAIVQRSYILGRRNLLAHFRWRRYRRNCGWDPQNICRGFQLQDWPSRREIYALQSWPCI